MTMAHGQVQRIRFHESSGVTGDGRGRGGRSHMRRRCQLLEKVDAIDSDSGSNSSSSVARSIVRDILNAVAVGGDAHQWIHVVDEARVRRAELRLHFLIVYARLLEVVDEMAARPVRAESDRVEGAAQFGLVLGMTGEIAQLVVTMSELTLVAILARAALFVRPTEFRLVT